MIKLKYTHTHTHTHTHTQKDPREKKITIKRMMIIFKKKTKNK
jgi:hypothetical protein